MLPSSRAPARVAMLAWAASVSRARQQVAHPELAGEQHGRHAFTAAAPRPPGPARRCGRGSRRRRRSPRSTAPAKRERDDPPSLPPRLGRHPGRQRAGAAHQTERALPRSIGSRQATSGTPSRIIRSISSAMASERRSSLPSEHHRLARPPPAGGADQVLDLELERIVAVHVQVLDERGPPVADGLRGSSCTPGRPAGRSGCPARCSRARCRRRAG